MLSNVNQLTFMSQENVFVHKKIVSNKHMLLTAMDDCIILMEILLPDFDENETHIYA